MTIPVGLAVMILVVILILFVWTWSAIADNRSSQEHDAQVIRDSIERIKEKLLAAHYDRREAYDRVTELAHKVGFSPTAALGAVKQPFWLPIKKPRKT